MNKAYIHSHNIICALGNTTDEVVANLQQSKIGIKESDDSSLYPTPFHSAFIDKTNLNVQGDYTVLEKIMIASVVDAMRNCPINLASNDTLFFFSTTKGNIEVLAKNQNNFDQSRAYLTEMAKAVALHFDNKNEPIVVSQACISGVLAANIAADYIKAGLCKNAVVVGGDLVTEFTISGFQSFMAISNQPCKPYDKSRDGISIGEAVGTLIISDEKSEFEILGGGSSNDANHISGPSRTGDGLAFAIERAFNQAKVKALDIDYLSAHGTATVYNDEMESKAFNWMGLSKVPMNSLKGYWGHTLGAAGIIEIIAGLKSLQNNELYKNVGFDELGVPEPINVITKYIKSPLKTMLKTASGFGGCNAAIIIKKHE